LFVTCGALSLVCGLFVIPAPYPQYTLLFLPLLAVLAAAFVWRTLVWLDSMWHGRRRRIISVTGPLAIGTAWAATAAVSIAVAAPFFRHPLAYPALALLAVATVALLVRRGRLHAAAAVVLVATSVYQAQQALWMSGLSNRDQLRAMQAVHAATGPDDTVLDGFSGYGWFRPHAWFYFFVHPGVRAAIPDAAAKDLHDVLASASKAPSVVIVDDHLRALIPNVAALLDAHYEPIEANAAVIWVRDGTSR